METDLPIKALMAPGKDSIHVYRVLLIENSPGVAGWVEESLIQGGSESVKFELTITKSANEAEQLAQSHSVDVILWNLSIPDKLNHVDIPLIKLEDKGVQDLPSQIVQKVELSKALPIKKAA